MNDKYKIYYQICTNTIPLEGFIYDNFLCRGYIVTVANKYIASGCKDSFSDWLNKNGFVIAILHDGE